MTIKTFNPPKSIWLAPMEGVMDAALRALITQCGGVDLCVTEFVRVSDACLPKRVFYRLCPELLTGGVTPAGTPVRVQLLGQDPELLARNAVRAVALGSHGVDLNFGCPARTVNRHRGGAVLLQEPETLHRIARTVRQAVPSGQPVSAKMRLGYQDRSLLLENTQALVSAGIQDLVVHARTKVDGYKPPAYWSNIAQVVEVAQPKGVRVIANGDIWTPELAQRCMAQSQTSHIMLGRGLLALPNLAAGIAFQEPPWRWVQALAALQDLAEQDVQAGRIRYLPGRVKQWLRYLGERFDEAQHCFQQVKTIRDPQRMLAALAAISRKTLN